MFKECTARGGDRKGISLRAGLHFRQRHLGALGALGAPEAQDKWGGEKRTPETRHYPPQIAAAAERAQTTPGTLTTAPAPHPWVIVSWCGDAPGRQPLLDWAPPPSRGGQRLPASGARRVWQRGWGSPGDAGWPGPGGPGGPVEGRAEDYLRCAGGDRRVAVGYGGLRPVAGQRSPVRLGRGPPLGVSQSLPWVLPTAVAGLGVRGVPFAHLSLSCRRLPR